VGNCSYAQGQAREITAVLESLIASVGPVIARNPAKRREIIMLKTWFGQEDGHAVRRNGLGISNLLKMALARKRTKAETPAFQAGHGIVIARKQAKN
jgi:hypothetical protein